MNTTIERFDVFMVRWPLRMTRRQGFGNVESFVPGVIVRLQTRDGITGWGEAGPVPAFTGTAEASAAALATYLRPIVVGRSADDVADIAAQAERIVVGHYEAKAAIDMALHDIIGKSRAISVTQLLGGACRPSFPLSVSIANSDFAADLDFVRRLVVDGVRLFKVKTGFLTHKEDLDRLERLSSILPANAEIRVDYNQALSPFGAIAKLRDIERFRPTFIEQPLRRDLHDAMREISRAIDTPILADESIFTAADALELVRQRFASGAAIKLMKSGSFRRARQVADILEAAGIAGFGGTMYEGGIGLSAGIHLVATTPNISLGAEFYAANFAFTIDILREPIRIENGQVQIPRGPGLGIDVDEDALKQITVGMM